MPAVSVPLPMEAAPSKKFTVPVGVPAVLVTVAVRVMDCAKLAGLAVEASVVVVADAELIVWVSAAEALDAKFPSVWYCAVIECEPTDREAMANVAWPAASSVPLPICAAPSKNRTAPVGVPPVLVTDAVNVTDWPTEAGLAEDATAVAVLAGLTVWFSAADPLPAKVALPLYVAVME